MTENEENKLIIAYLQDVIAQMSAYKEYRPEDSQNELGQSDGGLIAEDNEPLAWSVY